MPGLKRLLRRHNNKSSPLLEDSAPEHKIGLLDLPAELRLQVYSCLATPLSSSPSGYSGLYLSCKQIRNEMEANFVKRAPKAIKEAYSNIDLRVRIGYTPSIKFHQLSQLTIAIPRWALDARNEQHQLEILDSLGPVIGLHLSGLTIIVFENTIPDTSPFDASSNLVPSDRYRKSTTYANIVPLAMRITCLVFPEICAAFAHSHPNRFCRQASLLRWPPRSQAPPCNVRKITFRLQPLHPEKRFDDRRVYPDLPGDPGFRLSPLLEKETLRRWNWNLRGEFKTGGMPKAFVWERMDRRKSGKFAEVVREMAKNVLRASG